jgi:nucleoside-diphosphate-sugar epimerase
VSRAIVTGATGFLGSALARTLIDAEWDVHVIHRASPASASALAELSDRGAQVHTYTDLVDVRGMAADLGESTAFHLATHYLRDHTPSDITPLIAANVEYGTHLLDGLAGSGSRVVAAMSFFQYWSGAPATNSLYSATKQAFGDVAAFYREQRGLDIREVVLYDTYGPDDTRDKLVPSLVTAARSGRPMALGNPEQLIDLTYVADVVAGFLAAAREVPGPRVALRAAEPIRIVDLVAAVHEAVGTASPVTFDAARPVNDLVTVAGDWPPPLGWEPQTTLDVGLRSIVETASGA